MVGTVKIEYGMYNLYVKNVFFSSTKSLADLKQSVKIFGLSGYIFV
jgi:hypothetical protein